MLKSESGAALITAVVIAFIVALAAGIMFIINTQSLEVTQGTIEHRSTFFITEAASVITRDRIRKDFWGYGEADIAPAPSAYPVLNVVNTKDGSIPPRIDVLNAPPVAPAVTIGTVTVSAIGADADFPNSRQLEVLIDSDDPNVLDYIRDYYN